MKNTKPISPRPVVMHHDVVCIPLKWIAYKVPAHPHIKGMMQRMDSKLGDTRQHTEIYSFAITFNSAFHVSFKYVSTTANNLEISLVSL